MFLCLFVRVKFCSAQLCPHRRMILVVAEVCRCHHILSGVFLLLSNNSPIINISGQALSLTCTCVIILFFPLYLSACFAILYLVLSVVLLCWQRTAAWTLLLQRLEVNQYLVLTFHVFA